MVETAAAIQLQGICKNFPGVRALIDVDLAIAPGTCHALVGENGAGKSTLGKILAGIYTPDAGRMLVHGRRREFRGPNDAIDAGIGMVHQELLFCENLSVAENLNLGVTPHRLGFVRRGEMIDRAREWLARVGARVDPLKIVGEIPISQQQLVQIAGAVARGARVLIFDEPTSSLSRNESENLFDLMGRLKADGVTMLYVSHRLEEVFRLCDVVTVLRDGRHVATRPVADYTEAALVHDMIGRPVDAYFPTHLHEGGGEEVLRVEGLSSPGRFREVSFSLHSGEVLGLAGLVGAGRTEIAQALFGLDPRAKGRVWICGNEIALGHPRSAMRLGLGLIPEDRKRHGLVLSMNARENISLPILERLSRLGWVRSAAEHDLAARHFDRLNVRAPHVDAAALGLSGGNQQKLVVARWLAAECGILLVDEPTRGVDVGTKAEIHALLDDVARQGAAVLLISSELPEVLNLSTRILVLREGRIVGQLTRQEATQEKLLRFMAGLSSDPATPPPRTAVT